MLLALLGHSSSPSYWEIQATRRIPYIPVSVNWCYLVSVMLNWFLVMKLLHVLSAFLLIGGLLGRNLTFAEARRAQGVEVAYALLRASERFERFMVRPGSEIVLVFGLLTAWLERLPLLGVLTGARPAWLLVALVLYLLTIPPVFVVLLPRSKQRKQAAAAALAQCQITPDLRAALDNRAVRITRNVEMAIIFAVVCLMVLKPF